MEKKEWESNGRKLVFDDDGIIITPNRLDMLNIACVVYEEYLYADIDQEETGFAKWLEKEIEQEEECEKNTES